MEQVSSGKRFLPVYPPRTVGDLLTWEFAAGCKILILLIVSPLCKGERAGVVFKMCLHPMVFIFVILY